MTQLRVEGTFYTPDGLQVDHEQVVPEGESFEAWMAINKNGFTRIQVPEVEVGMAVTHHPNFSGVYGADSFIGVSHAYEEANTQKVLADVGDTLTLLGPWYEGQDTQITLTVID